MAHAALKAPGRPLLELALGAAWLIGLAALLQLINLVLGQSPLAAALAGAVAVDIAGGHAGVRWSGPGAAGGSTRARRLVAWQIGVGAGLGALAVALTLAAALALGLARAGHGHPSAALGFALLRAVALGVRDELMLTGIPFAVAARAGVSSRLALGFAALAHGAVVSLAPGAGASTIALALASGALFAALFRRFDGAWAAVAASASHGLLAGAGLRGGLLDVTWLGGAFAAGARAGGSAAWLGAAVFAALALLVDLTGGQRSGADERSATPEAPGPPGATEG